MVLYTLILQLYFKKWPKAKKKMILSESKNGRKNVISADGKGTVFSMKFLISLFFLKV